MYLLLSVMMPVPDAKTTMLSAQVSYHFTKSPTLKSFTVRSSNALSFPQS